jgi:hypothetical protein
MTFSDAWPARRALINDAQKDMRIETNGKIVSENTLRDNTFIEWLQSF